MNLQELFQLEQVPVLPLRYNIAPTQNVAAVRLRSEQHTRELVFLRWGLIPRWAKDTKIGNSLINGRADTVAEKPSFRSAFKHRRCLVIADGFYEWKKQGTKKQPFYFQLKDGEPFAFAGLWESWSPPDGEKIESCALLTTEANEVVSPVHDRMPVILQKEDYEIWLDPAVQERERLQPLLAPYPSGQMKAYPVSTTVNNARNDVAACVEPAE